MVYCAVESKGYEMLRKKFLLPPCKDILVGRLSIEKW